MRRLTMLASLAVLAAPPERFDAVSTPDGDELNAAFTPDGGTVYFTRTAPGGAVGRVGRIVSTRRLPNGSWSAPVTASFSGRWADFDPFVAPDGRRLFFISNRPLAGDSAKKEFDVWYVERAGDGPGGGSGDGWGAPARVDAIASGGHELFPSPTANGTLYFSACGRGDSRGGCDLYRARPRDRGYAPPEPLGDAINSAADETDAFVAPDESYIVLTSSGRADSTGRSDLYVTHALPGGGWSAPRKLGPEINTGDREYCPIVHGEYLYFTRQPKSGLGDVYRVPVSALRP
jgi:hypothetical protein